MSKWRFLSIGLMMSLAGVSGWMLNEYSHSTETPQSVSSLPLSSPSAQAASAVKLFPDGTITVNVQKRQLHWLLDEISRQGGRLSSTIGYSPAESAVNSPAPAIVSPAPHLQDLEAEQLQITRIVNESDDKKRYSDLLLAKSSGISLPESTLKTLMETDASELVRLTAFENYLEMKSGNTEQTRSILQAALLSPTAKIQIEARKLLDQLEETERINMNSQQTGM